MYSSRLRGSIPAPTAGISSLRSSKSSSRAELLHRRRPSASPGRHGNPSPAPEGRGNGGSFPACVAGRRGQDICLCHRSDGELDVTCWFMAPAPRVIPFLSSSFYGGYSVDSQNHSMVGVGRDLCGSPSPTPCPSRVTQSRLHSTASRRDWNISREGDSTTSLGNLFQCSML